MKRIISLLCACTVLLSLTACKSGDVASNSAADTETSQGAAAAQPEVDTTTAVTSPAQTAANSMSDASEPAADTNAPAIESVPLADTDIELSISADTEITTDTERFTIDVSYTGDADNAEYCYGSMYTLKKLTNGEWQAVPFAEDAAFNLLGYIIGSNATHNTLTVSLSDEFYAVPLTAGAYCVEMEIDNIVKQFEFTMTEAEEVYDPESEFSGTESTNDLTAYIPLSENDIIAELDSSEYPTGTSSVELSLKYVGSNDSSKYIIGREYSLEKWSNDIGDWRSIPFADLAAFTEEGYEISSASDCYLTLSIDASMFTADLTAGTYRITKPLCDNVNAYLVFELKDVDSDSGLTIESASGMIDLCIDEILDDKLICRLTFPSPLKYELPCDASLYPDLSTGDKITVEYAPMYRLDDMTYKITVVSIEKTETHNSAPDDNDNRHTPDY